MSAQNIMFRESTGDTMCLTAKWTLCYEIKRSECEYEAPCPTSGFQNREGITFGKEDRLGRLAE
jgi:hypothetical protein